MREDARETARDEETKTEENTKGEKLCAEAMMKENNPREKNERHFAT